MDVAYHPWNRDYAADPAEPRFSFSFSRDCVLHRRTPRRQLEGDAAVRVADVDLQPARAIRSPSAIGTLSAASRRWFVVRSGPSRAASIRC